MQKNILIVEDNKILAKLIEKSLSKNPSYKIFATDKIKFARNCLEKFSFDLICLDLILPDGNGTTLLKEIKNSPLHKNTKVLVISRKAITATKIEAFENGADDYLTKPFHPEELAIRVKKLLGLTNLGSSTLQHKNLSLDKIHMKFLYEDYEIPLTQTEFLLLLYLFENNGIAKMTFLTSFLSSRKLKQIDEKSVIVSIKRLKDKLRRNTGNPFIRCRYGVGYYLP